MALRTQLNQQISKMSELRDYLASTAYSNLQERAEDILCDLVMMKEELEFDEDVQYSEDTPQEVC